MKSKANRTVPQAAITVFPNIFFRNIYRIGSIRTPKSVPIKRQPKGTMPKRPMPMEMISFPRGGCVVS
jgi:hypothetical protein